MMDPQDFNSTEPIPLETIRLRMEKVATKHSVPDWFLRDCKLQQYYDHAAQHTLVRLWRYVLYHMGDEELHVPCTWQDHLKKGLKDCPWVPPLIRERLTPNYDTYKAREYLPELRIPRHWGGEVRVAAFRREP